MSIKKEYLSEIKHQLIGKGINKKRFIRGLSDEIDMYLSENKDATKDELYQAFGEPSDYVSNYGDTDNYVLVCGNKREQTSYVIVILALIVLIVGIWMSFYLHFEKNRVEHYIGNDGHTTINCQVDSE